MSNIQFPKTFPVLQTARMTLREIAHSDLTPLHEIANFDGQGKTEEEVEAMLEKLDRDFKSGEGVTWGMYLEDELVGTCGYYRGFENAVGEIGFVLRAPFRLRGLMYEAIMAALEYGFREMGLVQITAFTRDNNPGSIPLLYKAGFQRTDEFHKDFRKYELAAQ